MNMTNLYEPFSSQMYSRYAAECARMAGAASNLDASAFYPRRRRRLPEVEAISQLEFGKQNCLVTSLHRVVQVEC